MTRKSAREIERELDRLQTDLEPGPTVVVITTPNEAMEHVDGKRTEYPDGVGWEDIRVVEEVSGADPDEPIIVEEAVVPIHRPEELRGGIVHITYAEIAWVYAAMPDDVRENELELRREHDEPIPPILADKEAAR